MKSNAEKTIGFVPCDDDAYKKFCTQLRYSRSLDDLKARIQAVIEPLGLSDFLFTRLDRYWQSEPQRGLLSSFPSLCLQYYQENRLYQTDWLVAYAKASTDPLFSSSIHRYVNEAPVDLPIVQANRQVYQLYKRHGFSDFYMVPLLACNGHGQVLLLLGCAGMDAEDFRTLMAPISATCRSLCRAIDTVTTLQFRSLFIQQCDQPTIMTNRQLRMLRSLANEDCSIKELAEQLCIRPITAHQHVAAARKALGANTNIRAVVKAIHAGLITIQ